MKNMRTIYLVNGITLIRLLGTLTIPFMVKVLSPAGMVVYVSCLLLTDALDGFLARRLKAATLFGSLLDQFTDKLLAIVILAVLAISYPVMLFPIITELLIVLVGLIAGFKGAKGDSSILGKIKTVVLGITIVAGFSAIYAKEIVSLIGHHSLRLTEFLYYLDANIETIMTGIAFVSVGTGLMVVCDYYLKARNEIDRTKKGFVTRRLKLKRGKELHEALFCPTFYEENKNISISEKLGTSRTKKASG